MPCSRGLDRAKLVSGHSQYTVLPSLSILPTKRKISLCLESTKTKVVQSSEIPKNHYNINLARLLIPGKSLIYMTKSKGPSMLPCGTPYTMDSNDELEPFKETN